MDKLEKRSQCMRLEMELLVTLGVIVLMTVPFLIDIR